MMMALRTCHVWAELGSLESGLGLSLFAQLSPTCCSDLPCVPSLLGKNIKCSFEQSKVDRASANFFAVENTTALADKKAFSR